jgi:hypothetical protein
MRLWPQRLDQPLRWRRPRLVFVNSMSDLFHEEVRDEFIASVFDVMAEARHHTFQVLTKRPGRMASLLRREEAIVHHPGVTVRHYVFTGGCATVQYSFTRQTAPSIFDQAEDLIGYNLRSDHVRAIRREAGLTLCGAEAPPCPG